MHVVLSLPPLCLPLSFRASPAAREKGPEGPPRASWPAGLAQGQPACLRVRRIKDDDMTMGMVTMTRAAIMTNVVSLVSLSLNP
eukprot:9472402-Pyramimonas_sp.AAC.2